LTTTAFEVASVFRIIDQASPALVKILRQVRELRVELDRAKLSLAEIGKMGGVSGLSGAIAQTEDLSLAWRNVAKSAEAARVAMGQAAGTATRVAGAGYAVGGGGRARLGSRLGIGTAGGGGGGRGFAIGGGHGIRGGAMAAAGLVGYGAYEAAEMEDAVFQLIYHSGLEQNDTNRGKFRKILQDAMISSGYGLKDISESAKQEIRMFQGTPGGGIDVLPEMLRAATIESRLKGESPEESMKALIGLAHMTKSYDPEAIKKLAPAFAFLSTANPGSLGSIEKAAGYALPILQSGLEVDPMQSLLLGTALTRAGATSTKSGTWLREMALRAMPGSALMSDKMFEKHEDALHRLGLVDDKDKPTWFTGGKPDLLKMLDIAGTNAGKIPLTERAALERQLFGAQGAGGFALLADPAVRDQVLNLRREMESPEFKARYGGFVQAYQEGSTVQNARTAMQEFSVLAMDIGQHVLPAVNVALRDFKGALETIRNIIPGGARGEAKVLGRALEGAVAGGVAGGLIAGPGGALIGGAGGAVAGVGTAIAPTPKEAADSMRDTFDKFLKKPPVVVKQPPVTLNLNIDGRTLSRALSEAGNPYEGYATQAPAGDTLGAYGAGHDNTTDK
jgi:hypothetical protein